MISPYGEYSIMSERMNESKVLSEFEKKITNILCQIPSLTIMNISFNTRIFSDYKADLVIELSYSNKKKTLIVETKKVGEPRYIRSSIQQLSSFMAQIPDAYGIIAASFISERTGDICKKANFAYIDLSGNCYLSFNSIYIEKKNFLNIFKEKKEVKSLFSRKASRILRALLTETEKAWTQKNLSEKSKTSIGLTNRLVKKLYDLEYIDFDQNKTISIKSPSKLLDTWRENYTYKDNQIFGYYSPLSQNEFETRLIKYMEERPEDQYAFTLFSGASLIVPYVRQAQTFFYFLGNEVDLKKEMDLKPVASGANVLSLTPFDEGIFYALQIIRKRTVVSNVQLYLDLYNYKGRGREQAEHLRENTLEF